MHKPRLPAAEVSKRRRARIRNWVRELRRVFPNTDDEILASKAVHDMDPYREHRELVYSIVGEALADHPRPRKVVSP